MRILLFVTLSLTLSSFGFAQSHESSKENSTKAICNAFAENFARGEYQTRHESTGQALNIVQSETLKVSSQEYITVIKTQVWRDALLVDGPTFGYNCFICSQNKIRVSKEGSIDKACK